MLTFPLSEDEFSAAVRELAEDCTPRIIELFRRYDGADPHMLLTVVTNTIRAKGGAMVEEAQEARLPKRRRRKAA